MRSEDAPRGVERRASQFNCETKIVARARILLVEDNPVNQVVATSMLKKLGYQAELAVDGKQALAALDRADYDLVLMDCQMPIMDGFEATAAIRARRIGDDVTIVALTANAMDGDRERCLASGMDDYLSKPLKLVDLKTALSRWLRRATDEPSDEISAA